MIDHFVALCFRKRLLVGMMALFFCVYGVYAWTQLPVDAFVQLEGVDADAVMICCDLDAHIFNPDHTDPRIIDALVGTHWINVRELTKR